MAPSISIVFMTGNNLRHRFMANTLAVHLNLLGVVCEEKRPLPKGETEVEDQLIRRHFKERDEKEEEYFGAHKEFRVPAGNVLQVSYGESNSEEVFRRVTEFNPKYVALFGTSIIKDPLLAEFGINMINIHLGLSPYYRGTATNFWPLVENEPECAGATIHLATRAVDGGAILAQSRPEIAAGDTNHDIGNKAIIAGAETYWRAIEAYEAGEVVPQVQPEGGKLFKNKDFNADALIRMHKNFENEMIERYLADKSGRDAKFPIISLPS